MKKPLLIIITIAILGAIGLATQKSSGASSGQGLVRPANTTARTSTSSSANNPPAPANTSTSYKDGTYQGSSDTPYGRVQIAVVISGGKIANVNFLQMPSDQFHSQEVTAYSEPLLKQTTMQHQSAQIDFVSGATSTSIGYQASLQQALDQAQV